MADGRPGLVRRIRDARSAYKGPFAGAHVRKVVENAGYELAYPEDPEAFLVFKKAGRQAIAVNPSWDEIWDGDPIFRCLQRDLGISHWELRMNLNQARNEADGDQPAP